MMDDLTIQFGEGRLGVNMTKATLNEHLRPHGLCVMPLPAPAPPPQTEAERLVELANSLPQEVLGDESSDPQDRTFYACGNEVAYQRVNAAIPDAMWDAYPFRRHLLGAMAAYVGTEKHACVWSGLGSDHPWTSGPHTYGNAEHISKDLLTAYRDCCLAIAERRKGGT